MISLRAVLLRSHEITIKFARQNLPRVFHSLPGGQVNLIEKITCQSCGLSKIPHCRLNFIGIQRVSCSGMDSNVVELKARMESESDLPKNHAPNMQVEMSTGEGCGQTGPRAKAHIDSETSQSKKRDRKKPKKARDRGRKQKLKSLECASSLLQELPFANTIVWKDLGFETSEKAVKKKRKRGDSGRGESEEDGDKKKKRQPRPNYFVSIPITNSKIRDGIQAVQDLLVEKDKRYSKALIPVGSLHITLLVTYLSNEEEVDVARGVMAQMEQTVRDLLQGRDLVLPFLGIGNFRNEVAFVQLAEGAHVTVLTQIAEAVRKMFEEKGVSSRDGRAFKPHLTFVKLSKAPRLRSQGLKKIDPVAYESFLEHSFGEETVTRLDLCSMLKKKTPDGYFHCETSVTFGEKKGAELDDEELLSLSKRLVEDAVLRAVQQYMEETQRNADTPGDQGSAKPGQNLNASGSK